jgi:hypothetical protein
VDPSTLKVEITASSFSNGASPTTDPAVINYEQADNLFGLITTDTAQIRRELKSFIPTTGGKFFTGNVSVFVTATEQDPQSTLLRITPATALNARVAEISEVVSNPTDGLTSATSTTNQSAITMPAGTTSGYFAEPVTIYLRRDSSTIKNFNLYTKFPATVPYVLYQADPGEPWPAGDPPPIVQLTLCRAGEPNPNADGSPKVCISGWTGVTKKMVQQASPLPDGSIATPIDEGDWIIEIKALQNGKISY